MLFVYNLAVRRLDEEVRLTNFTISATLEENKDLTITKTAPQNQGENETSCILVTVPHSLVSGYEFYLEFLCPSNKKYLSPVLSKYEETETGVVYDCLIPACVLGEEGLVMFQLVARSDIDKSVVLKSNFSRKTSFFVRPSVNATEKTLRIDDYFASMQEKVDGFEEQLNTAQLNISNKVSFKKQSLSDAEKQQARENIGAGTSNFSGNYDDLSNKPTVPQGAVLYNQQTLNDDQKAQARENIGAGTSNFSGSYNDLEDKPDIPQNTVSFQAQSLSETEKQQARENIGAGTSNFSGNYDDLSNKPTVPQGAVLYNQQTLNDDQKAQARENIGAGTSNFSGSYNDLTDKPDIPQNTVSFQAQSLSDAEKQQARQNIGAGTSNFSGSYNDLTDKPAGGGGVTSWGTLTGDIKISSDFIVSGNNYVSTKIKLRQYNSSWDANVYYQLNASRTAMAAVNFDYNQINSAEVHFRYTYNNGTTRIKTLAVPPESNMLDVQFAKYHGCIALRCFFYNSDTDEFISEAQIILPIAIGTQFAVGIFSEESIDIRTCYFGIEYDAPVTT